MSLGIGIGISAVLLQAVGGPAYEADFMQLAVPPGITGQRASGATYFNSSGVPANAGVDQVRFDYDPVSGQLRGLLIEGQRTNFLLNSLSPATQTVSLNAGSYTVWCNGASGASVTAAAGTAVGSGFGTAVAGAAGTYGTYNTFTISTAGTVTLTVGATVPSSFQCENGLNPSSLIVTTASAATRANDLVTLSGVASFFNVGGPGSLIGEFMPSVPNGGVQSGITFTNGTNNNLFYALSRNADRSANGSMRDNVPSSNTTINGAALLDYTVAKLAFAWAAGEQVLATNGTISGTAARADISTNFTQASELRFGRNGVNASFLFGWLRKVTYYNSRLPNTQLQTLTA